MNRRVSPYANSQARSSVLVMGVVSVVLLWAMLFFYSRPNRHSHDEGHDEDQHNPLVTKPSRQFDFSGGEYVKLSNDVEMPIVLFGTAALKDPGSVIPYSLQLGLKGLDTASDVGPWYKTEGLIGQLIKDYELHRSDYFFVTKLHPSQHGYDSALKAVDASLKNLQSSYIDLYLIHYPNCFGDLCKTEPEGTWKDSWRAMEMLYKQKKLRALGVSNFQLDQLKELKRIANVQPHVVQGWFDPFHQPWELVEWCRSEGIVFQAYSPLGTQWTHKGDGTNPVFANKLIKTIADKHGRSPAQVVLKWLLQEGIAVVSRSNQHDHVKEMTELIHFNLPLSDMERLRALANSYKP